MEYWDFVPSGYLYDKQSRRRVGRSFKGFIPTLGILSNLTNNK